MENENIVSLEDRIPKLKQRRKKKANRRAIALLSVFFLLLIFVLYFLSPLSHVNKIKVEGNVYTTENIIVETSGLSTDTTIWKVDKEAIKEKLEKITEIKTAEISLVLPNTVQINVEEHRRLAYLVSGTDYMPILSNGKIIEPIENGTVPIHAPLIIGFKEGDELDLVVSALDELPEQINNAISEIHYEPTDTDKYRVRLFMNDGYEVSANSRTLADKLVHYPSIVSQLDSSVKGVIDLEVGSYFRAYDSTSTESIEEQIE